MDYDHEGGVMLEDSISVGDLLKNGGRFKINSNFIDMNDDDNLFPELETGEDIDIEFHEPIPSPWQYSFAELRALMKPLPSADPSDVTIYKKFVREGFEPGFSGEPLRYTVHYSGYFEKETNPFDSTYLQSKPKVFVHGQKEVLEGLELAVQSMRVGEESQFVIPYQLLFGEMGCPVRIPPRADGLFSITLISVSEFINPGESEELTPADRTKYTVVMPRAKTDYLRGKAYFMQQEYYKAARQFHKATNSLECCKLSNEEEQNEQQELLIKLYTNLAVCHNKLDNARKVCLVCNEIARISKISENCKALFQHGRALLKLGDFHQARSKLTQAQRLQPGNADITKELRLLAEKVKKHSDAERLICQRALGNTAPNRKVVEDSVDKDLAAFSAVTIQCLKDFQQNQKLRQMALPPGLSDRELDYVVEMIKNMNIELDVSVAAEKEYTLRKVESAA